MNIMNHSHPTAQTFQQVVQQVAQPIAPKPVMYTFTPSHSMAFGQLRHAHWTAESPCVSAVPEPSVVAMFAVGVIVVFLSAYRKRHMLK